MLPVSQYEDLLAEVRGLRRKAQHVQQLAIIPLITENSTSSATRISSRNYFIRSIQKHEVLNPTLYCNNMESILTAEKRCNTNPLVFDGASSVVRTVTATATTTSSSSLSSSSGDIEQECRRGTGVLMSADSDQSMSHKVLYHGTWPTTATATIENPMWNSDVTTNLQDVTSVMSFASSSGGVPPLDRILLNGSPNSSRRCSSSSQQQLEAKVDMVYSLLAMLSGQEHADMGETLLALSTNPESCLAMRQSGCIPLLVQMLQSDKEQETRSKATQALNNLIQSQPDEKIRKREMRIFKLLEQTRVYTEALKSNRSDDLEAQNCGGDDDTHPVQTVAHLMKLSFDEGHRQAICQLGGIYTIANLVQIEHLSHGSVSDGTQCVLMRRYACMALTNLTFGDGGNKALLSSFRDFIRALVVQLQSPSDELRQVTASVLRNLSWRADSSSKEVLREVGSVAKLIESAMVYDNKENTLKSILSALWNLSAHCTENKSEICCVDGALKFLVQMLSYKSPSKSLAIVENCGGILRNISSQIAVRDDYRQILRDNNCLQVLLDQLKSPSLTIVSNACGTLWNLSAKCVEDQEILWQLGAPSMLRSLNHSKHKMIAMGSSAALKNLLSSRPTRTMVQSLDSTALSMDLPMLPTLGVRKQKALLHDLNHVSLAETYENIEKDSSPVKQLPPTFLVDKSHKDRFNQGETGDFRSLIDASEPSPGTSTSQPSSLPFSGIPVKNMPKSVAKHVKSSSKLRRIDNDRFRNKEVRSESDEKDHCSIEDVSDGDDANPPALPTIYMEDIAIEILQNPTEDCTEKQDVEKEKYLGVSGVSSIDSGVQSKRHTVSLTPTLITQRQILKSQSNEVTSSTITTIDLCSSGDSLRSGHFGSNLPASTPLKLTTDEVQSNYGNMNLDEVAQVTQNDVNVDVEVSRMRENVVDKDPGLSVNLESNLRFKCFIDQSASKIANFNISQENNTSLMEEEESESCESVHSRQPMTMATINEPEIPEIEPTFHHVNPSECLVNLQRQTVEKRERLLERSCEETNKFVDNRMLDPDAMIESLDRFTAELVSQASSHLVQSNDDEKLSTDNTWNETTYPHDVTFPSTSESAPNVITFDTNDDDDDASNVVSPLLDRIDDDKERASNDFSSINTSTMTQSTLIAMEAAKMAGVFKTEAETSLDYDQGKSAGNRTKWRKKSLPQGLLAKRALSNSLQNGSSLESLSNLDQMNPPSILGEVFDMEGSMTSVASLPTSDDDNNRPEFELNGPCDTKNFVAKATAWNLTSVTDLDHVNPPSLFDQITDMCNSLADIATETELFEDCYTHVAPTTEDDVTEFSDANSVTPLQSDENTPETSPKKGQKQNGRQMTSKQKRNLARDRYKTYTVAAEMIAKEQHDDDSKSDKQFQSVQDEEATYVSPTYTVPTSSAKMTPKEPNVTAPAVANVQPVGAKTRLDIRRNFMQKRLENRDRFKTQTLSHPDQDLHLMVQQEANLVLESLRETKSTCDDLLECETLSLVSNDDDSEATSASSVNYKTYHKSWGQKKNVPFIQEPPKGEDEHNKSSKPKIVKPPDTAEVAVQPMVEKERQGMGVRGRRKPLYSKGVSIGNKMSPKALKPNLVKNVTSTFNKSRPPLAQPPRSANRPESKIANVSLERQGTFTRDETKTTRSRIPAPGFTRKLPQPTKIPSGVKSASGDRANRNVKPIYGRSTSADSRGDSTSRPMRKIQNSASSQCLKSQLASNGAVKKSSIPQMSGSNTNHVAGAAAAAAPPSNTAKKQVTSKIASLWKKIEDSKKQQQIPVKKDTRVWIEAPESSNSNVETSRPPNPLSPLIRSNTFDNNKDGDEGDSGKVTLRRHDDSTSAVDSTKRISRLGSFIVMDESDDILGGGVLDVPPLSLPEAI